MSTEWPSVGDEAVPDMPAIDSEMVAVCGYPHFASTMVMMLAGPGTIESSEASACGPFLLSEYLSFVAIWFDGSLCEFSIRDLDGVSRVEAAKMLLDLHAGCSLSACAPSGISCFELTSYALGYPSVDCGYEDYDADEWAGGSVLLPGKV